MKKLAALLRKSTKKHRKHAYLIEAVSACNLRCPSCPSGNMPDAKRPKGAMTPALLAEILDKIEAETERPYIYLYNWGEPLLNPDLPELVRMVKDKGFQCGISSNLNRSRDFKEILAQGLDWFRVSMSGFNQETYSRTHRGGDVETVKENMARLSEAARSLGSCAELDVFYHKYLHNMGEDYRSIESYCEKLGFSLTALWAYFNPAELLLAYFGGSLDRSEHPVLDILAVKPEEAREICLAGPQAECRIRRTETNINADGSVALCCAQYDASHFIADNFLDVGREELKKRKFAADLCKPCIENAIHRVYNYAELEKWDEIGNARLAAGGG